MAKKAVVIGAGINGLVAANYLARAGFDVTILERKDHAGGACTAGMLELNGKKYEYPQGASVFGFMEDFVFEETGLKDRVKIHRPEHPEIIYGAGETKPGFIWDDNEHMIREAKERWGDTRDIEGFLRDMDIVVSFLQKGYRDAEVPTMEAARQAIGDEIVDRWIAGSARALLDHYLTADSIKLYHGVNVIESGPISFDAPFSASTIPIMASGSVLDGQWGYVKGGIWQVPLTLDKLNEEAGVHRVFNAKVRKVSENGTVTYEQDGKEESVQADHVLFATDPLSAAKMIDNKEMIAKIEGEKIVGTSGKLIMFFDKPVKWKDDIGMKDFDSAFRYIVPVHNLTELEQSSEAVITGGKDFVPGYFEVYCEGAGDRELGGTRDYELVSIFFKNMALGKTGVELPEIKKQVEDIILSKVENPEALFHTILETPQDICNMFFFPGGNIDDVDLAAGQTFFQRTYSTDPQPNFYQFGSNPKFFYCAAGAYPCGSVAGTPGYMCAQQIIRQLPNVQNG